MIYVGLFLMTFGCPRESHLDPEAYGKLMAKDGNQIEIDTTDL